MSGSQITAQTLITVTFFDDYAAARKREQVVSLGDLAELIRTTTARKKAGLPWIKLARFGDVRSDKGALRHDRNVVACTGIECDYDGERISCERAVEIAEKAGLGCIVYTSPSHTSERPRWRMLCPVGAEVPPGRRAQLVSCLNGLYRGIFAAESWTVSQGYYYGSVNGNSKHSVHLVAGSALDDLDELVEIAIGKPGTKKNGIIGVGAHGEIDEQQLLELIRTGRAFHNAAIRLIGSWALRGMPMMEADQRLREAFDAVFPPDRDQRWHDRVAEIPKLLGYVYVKEAAARDGKAAASANAEAEFAAPSQPPELDAGVDGQDSDTNWGKPAVAETWPVLDEAAYFGLAGKVVQTISPHSESDPVALLIQFLVMVGNAIGRIPHYLVERDRHSVKLFTVLVGPTSHGRKGVSAGWARYIMEGAEPDWANNRIYNGMSTGEGLIWKVRDPITELAKSKTPNAPPVTTDTDVGVEDKRLLVVEAEFARALAVMQRDGNTLSAVIRDSWDDRRLMIMTKTSAAQASETHISIIGHITIDELRRALDETSMVNGFANRFLFACVRRSKLLPFGGDLGEDDIQKLAAMTHHTLETIRVACRRIRFTDSAAAIWTDVYPQLTAERPGIFGAVTARAEAQTLRLALLYALLDERNAIDAPHLTAALAIWKYCEASARYIFGDATGDPVADEILRALRACAPDGMTRTDIYNLLGRHRSRERTGAALATLLQYGKVRRVTRPSGGGRPVEIWMAS